MRERLCAEYAEPLHEVRERVRANPTERRLYNGLHRFLVEDLSGARPDWSRSRVRADCRDRTYRLIQRSNAWGHLLSGRFPNALRLSIHPRHQHHPKIGIRLADAVSDAWITPWHSVALVDARDGGRHRLVHRHEAERLGGRLVYRGGRPSHFVVDPARARTGPDDEAERRLCSNS